MYLSHAPLLVDEPVVRSAIYWNSSFQYILLLALAGIGIMESFVFSSRQTPIQSAKIHMWRTGASVGAIISLGLAIPLKVLHMMGREIFEILRPQVWLGHVPVIQPLNLLVGIISLSLGLFVLILGRSRPYQLSATSLYILAAISPAFSGHSRSTEPVWVMIGLDMIHLICGAFWLGGLIILAITFFTRRPAGFTSDDFARAMNKFSVFAMWSVSLLITSGLVMAVLISSEAKISIDSRYAQTLLLKILLVCFIGSIALWNRQMLVPKLRSSSTADAVHRLRYTLLYEVLLVLVVVVATGFLTNLSPGH